MPYRDAPAPREALLCLVALRYNTVTERETAGALLRAELDLTLYVRIIQAWPFTVVSLKSEEASVS
jgi:hypothetical protein